MRLHKLFQFEEHLCDIPTEEQTDIIREQVFTQVMGPDDHGRVRLSGARTTSSNIVGQNSNVDEMWVELDEILSNYKDLQSNKKGSSYVADIVETEKTLAERSVAPAALAPTAPVVVIKTRQNTLAVLYIHNVELNF
ncbi:hypothetical protein Q3G72_005975 [Acer saccharum]|nr:hypothetical protein Q3G72_005975 [Acer saccharum]